ncbi:DEAD/DEAH box helicase [Streptomyces sp. RB110-1]|uniref:helicase-related protein n=1 Tax=unclassified Streptomyces TaxID=2593676 RepID=UPI00190172AD|nr:MULTISPECIES: helicase-related protein [unclassified Streptomyces]MBK0371493.1 DEAD/DEAH box helicase [Streptomyces sp. RB110-1]MBK0385545.1 DEAD/DEAH box helicase [Streptomyces sp. RB110-2]
MTTDAPPAQQYAVGSLVHARGREWVVLPDSTPDLLVLRPLGGADDDIAGVLPGLETVVHATFAPPTPSDLGDQQAAGLLRTALRIGFRSGAGPFRSLASIAVDPRPYQLVPLLIALRQDTVRLLIADDVGIGKTVEAGLIAAELLAQGDARGLVVLCSPALAEQWRAELYGKFGVDARLVLPSTIGRLERETPYGQSVFRPDGAYVVSTDFIKSPRHREDFLRHCPDLVIVDEAHSCVSDTTVGASARSSQQRYALLRALADRTDRHLLLVTATPHSGKEEPFRRLIGLLDDRLAAVPFDTDAGRRLLAEFFVQRRRADIREDFQDGAHFPSSRDTAETAYTLHRDYKKLLDEVLSYARETVRAADGALQQRQRWWSTLALLRTLSSSPAAAVQSLNTRAGVEEADTPAEADRTGERTVSDPADSETPESADAVPGTRLPKATGATATSTEVTGAEADDEEKARLVAMAESAKKLYGPTRDAKLKKLITTVSDLLDQGYRPIVFCRYIATADYVADHLKKALNKKGAEHPVAIASVTGELSPDQRVTRIAELTGTDEDGNLAPERRVLVATDCLSEGVNLQESFDAVLHYDLAWNPTRHEQREGRVDRFGQRTDIVKALTLYGADNPVDGIVLNVLLRKHERIRRVTGISVPVPHESESAMQAVFEGLILRGERSAYEQEGLFAQEEVAEQLEIAWQSSAEREKRHRSRYAQHAIKKDEVAAEVDEILAALGTGEEVRDFTRRALGALRGMPSPTKQGGFTAHTDALPQGLRDTVSHALGPRHPRPVVFHDAPSAPRGEAALTRTDPVVAAVARFVLDAALDDAGKVPEWQRPARRCGVVRTTAVERNTTLLLVRHRFQLNLPARDGSVREQLAEDARVVAYRGRPDAPEWLPEDEAVALLDARATQNTDPKFATEHIAGILAALPAIMPELRYQSAELGRSLEASHRRVRTASRARLAGLKVVPQGDPDILGVYHYRPAPTFPQGVGA